MTILSVIRSSAAIFALTTGMASAATFSGAYGVTFGASGPGLAVNVAPSSGTGSFDLELGQSISFNIFDIWTTEAAVNSDDTVPQAISVAFTLLSPAVGSGTATGETAGNSAFFGLYQWGSLDWDAPVTLAFGTTGALRIELSDATFQAGYFGLADPFGTFETCKSSGKGGHDGKGKVCTTNSVFYGAEVMATITYMSADTFEAPAPVPLPAAGGLLLAGAGALAALRRRKG